DLRRTACREKNRQREREDPFHQTLHSRKTRYQASYVRFDISARRRRHEGTTPPLPRHDHEGTGIHAFGDERARIREILNEKGELVGASSRNDEEDRASRPFPSMIRSERHIEMSRVPKPFPWPNVSRNAVPSSSR